MAEPPNPSTPKPAAPDPWARGPAGVDDAPITGASQLAAGLAALRRIVAGHPWIPAVAVSAGLCFGHIRRWSLWQDEAFTWLLMQKDLPGIVRMAGQDRHPPLYYLIVAGFRWLGDSDLALRLPSAIGVVLAVAVTGASTSRHFGPRVGAFAAWLIALSPYALLYANTARMYGLLLCWGAALFASGLGLSRGARPLASAVVLGLAAAAAIWTHYAGAAGIAAAGLGTALDLGLRPASTARAAAGPTRSRAARFALLVLVLALAGLSFVPWALGPLRFQLANKDAPTDRTWTVLAYLYWAFDSRVPWLSVALAGLQALGLGLALRRRDPMLLGWALAGLVLPWLASRSGPAQNPRNYSDFLPAAAVLCALALDWLAALPHHRAAGTTALPAATANPLPAPARPGSSPTAPASAPAPGLGFALPIAALALLAADPLWDLWQRPVSPQEVGTGFDYHVEAAVLDAAAPANGGLYFRPPFLLTQYQRYAPRLEPRGKRPVDRYAWLASSRSEWVDSTVTSRFPPECTFNVAFREVLYAAPGAGCDALNAWLQHLASDGGPDGEGYVPFQLELARRAIAADRLDEARTWAERAEARLRAHPAGALTVTEIAMLQGDYASARAAAERAVAITRAWHWAGAAIAQAWTAEAKALEKLDRVDDRARALDAANCARKVLWPWMCGTGAGSGRVMSLLPLAPGGGPPPAVAPLPALNESQAPPPPADPPAGGRRLALWALDGEVLPSDWTDPGGTIAEPSTVMDVVDGFTVASLAVGPDRTTALACGPLEPASPVMAVRARWRADYAAGLAGARTWTFFEARMADDEGRVMQLGGSPVMERPMTTASGTSWRVDRFEFRTARDARQVRLCLKVDGAVPARLAVDWIELDAMGGE